ncbi:MAG: hypothetical protein NC191_05185 [Muribaculaceae bacterium]|nr:hypothetical protein [Muribaculaceae bacterium]
MSINAAASSSASVSSSTSVTTSSGAESTKKSSTESSFKDEMDKVSTKEQKSAEKNTSEVAEKKESATTVKDSEKKVDTNVEQQDVQLEGTIDYSQYGSMAVMDVNSMLANDIRQMMGLSSLDGTEKSTFGSNDFMTLDFTNSVSVSASDAEFFIGLTQNNDVSMANITAQAQTMLNNGAEVAEVKQNIQISQTLLDAISKARENNQPLRIDFDQNVSVILRINKEGVVSANFIPGDSAVEQYLRNNISSLRASFEEQELPYSDLSYSNRGSKQQKEKRNNDKK